MKTWLRRFLWPNRYQEEAEQFTAKMHDARQFGVERKRASLRRQQEHRRNSGLDYETLKATLFDGRAKGGES